MISKKDKWYKSWFNSPYYHTLYSHRDTKEAEVFIDNLCRTFRIEENQRALDVGCGRGRHAIYLNKKGLDVTGIDLSPENIAYASQYEGENLHFYVHDMRHLFFSNYFDYVFNLFTSFGYFNNERDDLKAIHTFSQALKNGGVLFLDFINTTVIHEKLIQKEQKTIEGIDFNISRTIKNNTIVKTIQFCDKGINYEFKEEVKALTLSDFEKYFNQKHLKRLHLFGDYSLNHFDPQTSERLIMICQKN